jgi:uncharacterized protein YbjT (DUF2867 family)
MRKLLLTGASGFLGWHICELAKKEWAIFGTVFSHPTKIEGVNVVKADLTDFNKLKRIFNAIRPDVVIHTAAIKDPNFASQTEKKLRRSILMPPSILPVYLLIVEFPLLLHRLILFLMARRHPIGRRIRSLL